MIAQQTNNIPPSNRLFNVIVFLIIIIFYAILTHSCSPEKRQQRLDNKSLDRVITKRSLLDAAGEIYQRINPCVVQTKDSIVTKHDTIPSKPILIPYIINKTTNRPIDTIVDGISVYVDSLGNLAIKNLDGKQVETKTIYKTQIDHNAVDSANAIIQRMKQQLSNKDGIIETKSEQISDIKKENNNKNWYLIGSSALALVLALFHIKNLITKIPIPNFLQRSK